MAGRSSFGGRGSERVVASTARKRCQRARIRSGAGLGTPRQARAWRAERRDRGTCAHARDYLALTSLKRLCGCWIVETLEPRNVVTILESALAVFEEVRSTIVREQQHMCAVHAQLQGSDRRGSLAQYTYYASQ